jgi:hypothetical protein
VFGMWLFVYAITPKGNNFDQFLPFFIVIGCFTCRDPCRHHEESERGRGKLEMPNCDDQNDRSDDVELGVVGQIPTPQHTHVLDREQGVDVEDIPPPVFLAVDVILNDEFLD